MPDSAGLRSFSEPCSYSFLAQDKFACENILRARICTVVRTGAKRAHISLVYCGSQAYGLYSPRTLGMVGGEGVINMQFFQTSKKRVETSE